MRFIWRAIVILFVVALAALVFFIVRSGLGTDWIREAVQKSDAAGVRRLLTSQPDLANTQVLVQGSRSTSGKTRWAGRQLVHVAVDNGSVETLTALAEGGADLNVRLDGNTLLHLAAAEGDIAVMTWLLSKGADVSARNGCEHPRDAMCGTGQFAGDQPSARPDDVRDRCPECDGHGQSPLHAAMGRRADEAAALLLSHGANVAAIDAAGRTPLHLAAIANAGHAARVLCSYGASVAARDAQGRTPEDLARAEDAARPTDRVAQTGLGEIAGWLTADGPCAAAAARARPGAPVPLDEVIAAWTAYACRRDRQYCR